MSSRRRTPISKATPTPTPKDKVFIMVATTRRVNNKLEVSPEYEKALTILRYIANDRETSGRICSDSVSPLYMCNQLGIEPLKSKIRQTSNYNENVHLPCVIILAINIKHEDPLQFELDLAEPSTQKHLMEIARKDVYSFAFCFGKNINGTINKPEHRRLYLDVICSESIHKFGIKIFRNLYDYALAENYDTISLSSISSVLSFYYTKLGFKFTSPSNSDDDFIDISSYKTLDDIFETQYLDYFRTVDQVAKLLNIKIKNDPNDSLSDLSKKELNDNKTKVMEKIEEKLKEFSKVLEDPSALGSSTSYLPTRSGLGNGVPMELFISDKMRMTPLFNLLNDTNEKIRLSSSIRANSPLREGFPRSPKSFPTNYVPTFKVSNKRPRTSELQKLNQSQGGTFQNKVASSILNKMSGSLTSPRSTRRRKTTHTSFLFYKSKVVANRKSKVVTSRKSKVGRNRKSKVVTSRKSKVVTSRKSKVVANRKSKVVRNRKSKVVLNRKSKSRR